MELILIKSLRKVGKVGDCIKVKSGYGRNYLIPQKFAIRATENNKLLVSEQKSHLEEKDNNLYQHSKDIADLIKDKELTFVRQAAEDGKLFGSVTVKEIAKSLSSLSNSEISHTHINLITPIKYVGIHKAEIELHANVIFDIKLIVGRSETEVQALQTASITPANVTDIENEEVVEIEKDNIEDNILNS